MKRFLLIILVLGLSGCAGRVVDWAKETVNQGTPAPDFVSLPHSYVRSISIYDQFDSKANFSALWLSDVVRSAYAQLISYEQGKNDEQKNVLMRRQLAENEHFIMFYLLSPYEEWILDKESAWNYFLDIDGAFFEPVEINKGVELASEYKSFFGKRYSQFQIPYLVKFNACDRENKRLINPETKQMSLVFRSASKEGRLVWNLAALAQGK